MQHLNAGFSKEPCMCSIANPLNARVCSPDSSLQLTVLRISILPLPGCSSPSHYRVSTCFFLGVSPPTPPRQPALSRRRKQPRCLQYLCYKCSLLILNTASPWVYHPTLVSGYCRYFLAQMGVIRQPSPVDKRWSLCPTHQSVASEAFK